MGEFEINSQEMELFKESILVNDFNRKFLSDELFLHLLQEMKWAQPKEDLIGHGHFTLNDTFIEQWIFWQELENNQFAIYVITRKDWL